MAQLIGGLASSHIPAIGGAIHKGLQADPYWAPFFAGYPPVQKWLGEHKPDVMVIFYNDHGLNFFLDKMPTFAVGAASEYRNADEGWGIPTLPPFKGEVDLRHHQEWIAACKGGKIAGSNFDWAGPLAESVLLGNVALRVQLREDLTLTKLHWDAASLKFTNLEFEIVWV